MWIRVLLSIALLAVIAVESRADAVYMRGRDTAVKGDVKSESAKEVVIGKDPAISGGDVIDVQYDNIKPIDLNLSGGAYKIAKDAEKELRDGVEGVKRRAALNRALKGYTETIKLMQPHKFAGRHFEYKIAVLTIQLAVLDQVSTTAGLANLQEFKSRHSDSWQINQVVPLIAQLQLDNKDYKGAAQTFQEMSEMTVFSEEMRREAELKVVQVAVKENNFDLAQKRLDALGKKATGAFASRLKLARAEVLTGQKKIDEAIPLLNQVIKENTDKQVKALAHNTLGECLFRAGRHNDALWEFLWVDTVYNQDKAQHAKALYYLWQTFDQLNNAERAQECRELLNEGRFAGTEYQRVGQAKQK